MGEILQYFSSPGNGPKGWLVSTGLQDKTWLQLRHSDGIPKHSPFFPPESPKQAPEVEPGREGPAYLVLQLPPGAQKYRQGSPGFAPPCCERGLLPPPPGCCSPELVIGLLVLLCCCLVGRTVGFTVDSSLQDLTLLQSLHSGGVPLQEPPKAAGKQEPMDGPPLGGPVYLTVQPPLALHS